MDHDADPEARLLQQTRRLNQAVHQDPADEDAWLQLVQLQLEWHVELRLPVKDVLEKQDAILARAISALPAAPRLLSAWLHVAALREDPDVLCRRWYSVLQRQPQHCGLWLRFLTWARSHRPLLSLAWLRELCTLAVRVLPAAAVLHHTVLLHLAAGHCELAVAMSQACIELSWFPPVTLPPSMHRAHLARFWASGAARFPEPGASGFGLIVDSAGAMPPPPPSHPDLPPMPCSNIRDWLTAERLLDQHDRLPARVSIQDAARCPAFSSLDAFVYYIAPEHGGAYAILSPLLDAYGVTSPAQHLAAAVADGSMPAPSLLDPWIDMAHPGLLFAMLDQSCDLPCPRTLPCWYLPGAQSLRAASAAAAVLAPGRAGAALCLLSLPALDLPALESSGAAAAALAAAEQAAGRFPHDPCLARILLALTARLRSVKAARKLAKARLAQVPRDPERWRCYSALISSPADALDTLTTSLATLPAGQHLPLVRAAAELAAVSPDPGPGVCAVLLRVVESPDLAAARSWYARRASEGSEDAVVCAALLAAACGDIDAACAVYEAGVASECRRSLWLAYAFWAHGVACAGASLAVPRAWTIVQRAIAAVPDNALLLSLMVSLLHQRYQVTVAVVSDAFAPLLDSAPVAVLLMLRTAAAYIDAPSRTLALLRDASRSCHWPCVWRALLTVHRVAADQLGDASCHADVWQAVAAVPHCKRVWLDAIDVCSDSADKQRLLRAMCDLGLRLRAVPRDACM